MSQANKVKCALSTHFVAWLVYYRAILSRSNNIQTLGTTLSLLSIRQGSPGVPSFLHRVNLTTPGYDWYVTWGYSDYLVTRDQSDFKTG